MADDISAIRTKIAAMLRTVTGVNAASEYPPDKVTVNGSCWVGTDDEALTPGSQLELSLHSLPIICAVARKSRFGSELKTIETIQKNLKTKARSNVSLTNTVDRFVLRRIQQVPVRVGDDDWIGFVAMTEIKTTTEVSYSG